MAKTKDTNNSLFRIAELARRIGVSKQYTLHLIRGYAHTEKWRKAMHKEIIAEVKRTFPEFYKAA
jgi:hypothetical protein